MRKCGRACPPLSGEAVNARGERKTARIRTANSYSVTITGALEIIDYLLTNEPGGGAFTPAQLLGPGLVERLPESGPLEII